ncbi:MAG: CDP-glucose 4,6-dehydratase [Endomicrobium sp.]|jgi:CDP-glucose 4,6-dehydratase|nr:CDP-glucose 4,6-dehydratase [Endomicrobium sp.]
MTEFFKNKKVFITGHTGFKGTWLCKILNHFGADITGYALAPESPSLFEICEIEKNINNIYADIRDLKQLNEAVSAIKPEIVIHMAAQPLVRDSYKNPVYTYETNVMGTVNILEAVRQSGTVKSFLNVTSDKVYKNIESEYGYKETDELNGRDPYSNSKSCSELVTESYKKSFFGKTSTAISTARAGNVIGGGDFASDRIIPDCIKAIQNKQKLIIRNPNSVRPYQHVVEALFGYSIIIKKQFEDRKYEGNYNIGPEISDCIKTSELADLFFANFENADWEVKNNNEPHEAGFLRLDNSKIKKIFNWQPQINIKKAVDMTARWTKAYLKKEGFNEIMNKQIKEYKNLIGDII